MIKSIMHIDWLNSKITVEEAESRFMNQDDRISPDPVPFGFFNHLWNELKAEMIEGYEFLLISCESSAMRKMTQ